MSVDCWSSLAKKNGDWVRKSMDDELVVECPLCRETLSFQELRRGVEQVCRHCGGLFALPVEAGGDGDDSSREFDGCAAANEKYAEVEIVPNLTWFAWKYVVEVSGVCHVARYNMPVRFPVASGRHELVVSLAVFPWAKKWKIRTYSARTNFVARAGEVHSYIFKQSLGEIGCVLEENGIRGGVPHQWEESVVGARVVSEVEVRIRDVGVGQTEPGTSKYCTECGSRVVAKAKFCSECGTSLT